MRIKKVILLLVWVFKICSPNQVFANEATFSTQIETTYQITSLGTAAVTHQITLTNEDPTVYAKQFALQLNTPNIDQVVVSVDDQVLEQSYVNFSRTTHSSNIGILLPEKVLGETKHQQIQVSYSNPDATVVTSSTMTVYVPPVFAITPTTQQTTVITPSSFGQPSVMQPVASSVTEQNGYYYTTFDNSPENGIVVSFGDRQVYDLKLHYQLENNASQPGLAQIALPPDTTRQKINLIELSPTPANITSDEDGNWLASYQLASNQQLSVSLTAQALVTLNDNHLVPPHAPVRAYTTAAEYWESDQSIVSQIVQTVQTPAQIYDYLLTNFDHLPSDTITPPRKGAATALQQQHQLMCDDYTDAFVALSRANGVPARRLTGFAYTQDTELRPLGLWANQLHCWPEYYDVNKKSWVPVDPTWGDTTGGINYFSQFDVNHIVFAINGVSSTKPFPAGTYGSNIDNTDIEVRFGSDFPQLQPNFAVNVTPQLWWGIPMPGAYLLSITNNSGFAWYNIPIQISTDYETVNISPHTKSSMFQQQVDLILPFQTINVPFFLSTSQPFTTAQTTVQLHVNEAVISESLLAGPQFVIILALPPIILGVVVSSIIITLCTGSLLVFRRLRSGAVRRKSQRS